MTVTVPGAHLVELLQLDPLPQTSAAADANVIGAWVRVTVEDLERTMRLYRDALRLLGSTLQGCVLFTRDI
jgi:hypothetical protein